MFLKAIKEIDVHWPISIEKTIMYYYVHFKLRKKRYRGSNLPYS